MNGLIEIVMQGILFGQETITRWNYLFSGSAQPNGFAFGLAKAMGFVLSGSPPAVDSGTILEVLHLGLGVNWSLSQVIARDVYNPLDFVDIPYTPPFASTNGSGLGEPPYTSYGFRTNRTRLDIGRGYKRIPGVQSGEVLAGGVIDGTFLTGTLATLASLMSDTLTYTDGALVASYQPCVVQKKKPAESPVTVSSTYYPTYDLQVPAHVMTGITWEAYTQVRTQSSRQYGKGS